jgi:hypothetical protein
MKNNPSKLKKTLCAIVIAATPLVTAPKFINAQQNQKNIEEKGVYYPVEYEGGHFLIPQKDIYDITTPEGYTFDFWWTNEDWENNDFPRTRGLLMKILEYVNKKPFNPLRPKAGKPVRLIDLDNDGYVSGMNMLLYGRRVSEKEMDDTIKHNQEYDKKVKIK